MDAASPIDLIHSAFYQLSRLEDPKELALRLTNLAEDLANKNGAIAGLIWLADEGINATIAGPSASVHAFETTLKSDARFANIVFKHSYCQTPPFSRLSIQVRREVVAMGIESNAYANNQSLKHTFLDPLAWRALMQRDDVVLIDNRNSFEFRLGRFKKAIDPGVEHFKDFPAYMASRLPEWKAEGKTVAMYCTGGIRCEKAGAWLHSQGLTFYQLDGGILNYFQTLPDANKDFEGHCYVFDNRVALDSRLQQVSVPLTSVYEGEPNGEWRLARAKRLLDAVQSKNGFNLK
jgi:UPF0176 protein